MTHNLWEDNPSELKIDSSPIPLGRVLLPLTRRFLPASSVVNIESLDDLFLCFWEHWFRRIPAATILFSL
ncbi:hypothetical protein BHE74_00053281 [Ensete ventricosum]|uniref:Uncharacterized protein n=1 Tax=Ensete ventricosum TaxID=4639 RepID=A0A426YCH8_ENSVE|nr:hypothetical protein B296_00052408 [Ensete ventricosum]RWW23202.1 hypothetical protein GW17_00012563 [Ensete ventricosum]RWW41245.1 hypothetical protein BHE74_00053281 [Ensete ventricosum]RZS25219.1 hypothetical protein BHM03_00058394 [Ensete ventricosum]